MDEWTDLALSVDVTPAGQAVQVAALAEAGRQADALLGRWPAPGSIEWHAEEGTDTPQRRERAWHLLQLRIGMAAGMEVFPTVLGLRRHGSPWEEISRAAGEDAEKRWSAQVTALLG